MAINIPSKLSKAIHSLILSNPFFATIILQRNIIIDDSCNTAWTDGDTIAFSTKFIEENDLDILKFTLCHEVLHITNLHHTRMKNKDSRMWNEACDYAINLLLREAGFKLWPNCLIKDCYKDMASEDIYRILTKNQKPQNNNKNNNQNNSGGNQNNSSNNNPANNSPTNSNKSSNNNVQQSFGEVRPCANGKEAEKEEEAKVQSKQAERIAKQQGKLPSFIERMFKNIPSNTDWREALAQFASVVSNNDYSWNKVNTRYSHTGFIFPGLYSKEIGNVIVACDTSGSISENEIGVIVSELFSILENLEAVNKDSLEIPVIYCDAIIQRVETLQIGDIPKPKGGGGTDFRPPFEYVEKNLNTPAGLIYLTDGYCGSFPENPGYSVLWALFKNNPTFKPPFGEIVYIVPGSY